MISIIVKKLLNICKVHDLPELKDIEEKKERYHKVEVYGGLAYQLKEEFKNPDEPVCYICPMCFEKDGKYNIMSKGDNYLKCDSCTTHYRRRGRECRYYWMS